MDGITARKLEGRVNLVVVSDHGMAEAKPGQAIYLDDYVDLRTVDVVDLGPVVSLSPRRPGDDVYGRLSAAHPHLQVYRKSELPERYHYGANPRIPAIVGIADEGWVVTTRRYVASRGAAGPRGVHGYPPDVPSMRAIFIARGAAFSKGIVEPFQNIHIYPLLAKILGLRPAPSDGVLDSVRTLGRSPRTGS
jgi:predicted AlkP superfamily pyrophosphatase or phosphodiesterase